MERQEAMSSEFEKVEINGKKYYIAPPNASRMVRAMGRLSYDFEQAIADLVDNSIAANATMVEIVIDQRIGCLLYTSDAADE